MSEPIRVLLVDDDPLVRSALQMMLGGQSDIRIAGQLEDGDEVVSWLDAQDCDVILMDIRMPTDGMTATRAVLQHAHPPAVVILTTFEADPYVLAALRAGAAGYLVKSTPPEHIIDAIRRAASGEPVVSAGALQTLIDTALDSHGDEQRRSCGQLLARLTDREREVADSVADGQTNSEISRHLHMSISSVKAHVSSILDKLGVTNRIQIALIVHDAR